MAEGNDTAGLIYQNLIDAGCDQQTTEKCMTIVKQGSCAEMLPILSQHRTDLLRRVHFGQKQINCLDYLICKIQQEQI